MNTSSFLYKNSLCNTTNGTVNDSANEVVDSEIWKDIEGYEGLYQVSDQGRVKSLGNNKKRKDKILKPATNTSGYLFVVLQDSKRKYYYVHRLVAQAFVPNDDPEHKTECNHINEIKTDCRACNINWMSRKENVNWGTGIERSKQKKINNPEKSKPVKQMTLDGQVIAIWPSIMEAQRNGFNSSNIYSCCQGKYKTHKGYKWEYEV